ncbi:MAG TPA: hypothetical protein G4O07_08845 [Dehalococcoidia bacterium]|nr:hypothetical protein [Dehalococcoidia bacterium]
MVSDGNERSESFSNSAEEGKEYFMEHKEKMKLFRTSHTNLNDAARDFFNTMVPYNIGHHLAETGGTASLEDEYYWLTLVPVNEVTGRRFLRN